MKKSNDTIAYIGSELDVFKNAHNWKSYFSNTISSYISGDVLEVGAGIGANTRFLSNTSNKINSWCAVEPDSDLAAEISQNTADLKLNNFSVINGTIAAITGTLFDTIIYIDVLEHIEDSKDEIKRAKALLKPGGYLIILVPAYNFLFSEFDKSIGHFRRYDKNLLMNEIGGRLEKIRLYHLDSVGFGASVFNKYFLKKAMPSAGNVKFWDGILVPVSRITDLIVFRFFGKSLIGIFKNVDKK